MEKSISTDSLRSIIYFITVARCASFTAASEELGVSKSALGKSVSKLEEHLSTKLFHRTTRKVTLTTEGEAYLASCQVALQTLSRAELALKSKQQHLSGNIRIDVPAAFGRRVVMPILLDIMAKFPALKLTLTFNDKVIDPLEAGFDLAFRFGAIKETHELVARKLNEQRLVICASPSYLAEYGVPKELSELDHHRCIMAWRGGKPLPWRIKNCSSIDEYLNPQPYHQISDGDAMVDAAIAGAGIIQFPESLLRDAISNGNLAPILSQITPEPVQLHVLWPTNRYLMPSVRFVIDEFIRLSSKGHFN